jgi:hypothetical protein
LENAYMTEKIIRHKKVYWRPMTFEKDVEAVERHSLPAGYDGPMIVFMDTPEANLITSIFRHSIMELSRMIDDSGVIHTYTKNAPRYFKGFGTWGAEGPFYDCAYSRDGSRALMTHNSLNCIDLVKKSIKKYSTFDNEKNIPENYFKYDAEVVHRGGRVFVNVYANKYISEFKIEI